MDGFRLDVFCVALTVILMSAKTNGEEELLFLFVYYSFIYLFFLSLTRVNPSVTGTDLEGGPAYNSSSRMEGKKHNIFK